MYSSIITIFVLKFSIILQMLYNTENDEILNPDEELQARNIAILSNSITLTLKSF